MLLTGRLGLRDDGEVRESGSGQQEEDLHNPRGALQIGADNLALHQLRLAIRGNFFQIGAIPLPREEVGSCLSTAWEIWNEKAPDQWVHVLSSGRMPAPVGLSRLSSPTSSGGKALTERVEQLIL